MIFRAVVPPRVVFVGLSLELYRRGTPDEFAAYEKHFRIWSERLAEIAEIAASGVACTREEIEALLRSVPGSEIDAVVIASLSYTVSRPIADALKLTSLPVVIWNTQQADSFDENYTPKDLGLNHTVQGTQDITNVLFRRGRDFTIVTGHYADSGKLARLRAVLETVRAARAMRSLRTGTIGGRFEEMDDFLFDETQLRKKLGWEFQEVPLAEYLRAWEETDDSAIREVMEADREKFAVSPALTEAAHRASVRGYLALRRIAREHRFDAMTFNFLISETEAIPGGVPFYGINRMMEEGMGYAGEGDSLRAALCAGMRLLAGSANFTEIYTVDFVNGRFMMSHMQECNPAWARHDRKVELRQMPFWLPGYPDYAGMYFTLEPMPVTLVTLTEDGRGGYRFVAFTGEIEDIAPLRNYDRAHWILRVPDAARCLDRYSEEGGTHHLIAMQGDQMEKLRLLAKFQRVDFVDVGA